MWIIHTEPTLTHQSQLSLCLLEQLDAQSRRAFISILIPIPQLRQSRMARVSLRR
jgi:hypothetical protein